MMRLPVCVSIIAALSASGALACGGTPICTVKDPTGTPLNIREGPAGKIVGSAKNGTKLEFIDHVEVKGGKWARVGRYDPNTEAVDYDAGYLFGPYLDCETDLANFSDGEETLCTVKDPTGTPLNIRIAPGGEILGSVRTGQVVRVNAVKSHNGKLWALAWRDPSDNAVGWVFDPYLQCEEDEAH